MGLVARQSELSPAAVDHDRGAKVGTQSQVAAPSATMADSIWLLAEARYQSRPQHLADLRPLAVGRLTQHHRHQFSALRSPSSLASVKPQSR